MCNKCGLYEKSPFVINSYLIENKKGETILVEHRGAGTWAIVTLGLCLSSEGNWDYEPSPSNRSNDFIQTHRFALPEALKLAEQESKK